jgi:hypothetical protein
VARNLVIAVIVCGVALLAFLASNPLRRSESSIRRWVQKTTPFGSNLSEVQAKITERGWYFAQNQGGDGKTSGTFIRGELGDYQGLPFRTSVTVFWEFDASNRLADIRVWKTRDGL